ncbi:MAG TPA: hypothetical protein ENJ82_09525 [Bacteroidetes bacterium]|nr:hypothetical protein [Bacteroidota bacterium]
MPAKGISAALRTQAENNRNTAANAAYYASHRRKIMDLVDKLSPNPADRIMVFGAGNANDLELSALCRKFKEVHLVDWDAAALQGALAKTGTTHQQIFLHGGIDLSEPKARSGLPTGMDMVLSTCLFSQITARIQTGKQSTTQALAAILTAREDHFQFMVNIAKPAGSVLFISDLISSDTVPDLAQIPAITLRERMEKLIEQGNFFTGLKPRPLLQMLMCKQKFRERIAQVTFVDPWRWQLSEKRSYLVYGIHFKKI